MHPHPKDQRSRVPARPTIDGLVRDAAIRPVSCSQGGRVRPLTSSRSRPRRTNDAARARAELLPHEVPSTAPAMGSRSRTRATLVPRELRTHHPEKRVCRRLPRDILGLSECSANANPCSRRFRRPADPSVDADGRRDTCAPDNYLAYPLPRSARHRGERFIFCLVRPNEPNDRILPA